MKNTQENIARVKKKKHFFEKRKRNNVVEKLCSH